MKSTLYFNTIAEAKQYFPDGVPSNVIAIVGDGSQVLVSSDNAATNTQQYYNSDLTNDEIVNTMVQDSYDEGHSDGYAEGYDEGVAAGGGGSMSLDDATVLCVGKIYTGSDHFGSTDPDYEKYMMSGGSSVDVNDPTTFIGTDIETGIDKGVFIGNAMQSSDQSFLRLYKYDGSFVSEISTTYNYIENSLYVNNANNVSLNAGDKLFFGYVNTYYTIVLYFNVSSNNEIVSTTNWLTIPTTATYNISLSAPTTNDSYMTVLRIEQNA